MYETLIRMKDTSAALATMYYREGDEYMAIFWGKCAQEYERRANNLTVGEAA